jgi:hypothetical protein
MNVARRPTRGTPVTASLGNLGPYLKRDVLRLTEHFAETVANGRKLDSKHEPNVSNGDDNAIASNMFSLDSLNLEKKRFQPEFQHHGH